MILNFYMQADGGKKQLMATAELKDDRDVPRFLHDFADHLQAEIAKAKGGGK